MLSRFKNYGRPSTVALELMDQLPDLDWIVGSIGGGGYWLIGLARRSQA